MKNIYMICLVLCNTICWSQSEIIIDEKLYCPTSFKLEGDENTLIQSPMWRSEDGYIVFQREAYAGEYFIDQENAEANEKGECYYNSKRGASNFRILNEAALLKALAKIKIISDKINVSEAVISSGANSYVVLLIEEIALKLFQLEKNYKEEIYYYSEPFSVNNIPKNLAIKQFNQQANLPHFSEQKDDIIIRFKDQTFYGLSYERMHGNTFQTFINSYKDNSSKKEEIETIFFNAGKQLANLDSFVRNKSALLFYRDANSNNMIFDSARSQLNLIDYLPLTISTRTEESDQTLLNWFLMMTGLSTSEDLMGKEINLAVAKALFKGFLAHQDENQDDTQIKIIRTYYKQFLVN